MVQSRVANVALCTKSPLTTCLAVTRYDCPEYSVPDQVNVTGFLYSRPWSGERGKGCTARGAGVSLVNAVGVRVGEAAGVGVSGTRLGVRVGVDVGVSARDVLVGCCTVGVVNVAVCVGRSFVGVGSVGVNSGVLVAGRFVAVGVTVAGLVLSASG